MAKKKLLCTAVIISIISVFLGSCGEAENSQPKAVQEAMVLLETAPELSYQVPQVLPGVLVPQYGYRKDGEKTVIFRGSRLPEAFSVIDTKTKEAVYIGKLEPPVYNTELSEYISYGEFTAFEEEGEYYIQCELIGRSYEFEIREGIYGDIMEASLKKLKEGAETGTQENCRVAAALLLAWELFPDVHKDGVAYTENGIPDILEEAAARMEELAKLQDEETGGLGEKTAWYAAVMAKFSYSYQEFDNVLATRYIQLADKAWKYMEKHKESTDTEERFMAAAELYRATGQYKYHSVVKELGRELEPDMENEALLYGSITYAATKSKVDVELCSKYLLYLMEQAEQISADSKEAHYLVETQIEQSGIHSFFEHMTVMSVVDYVITNHEYATVIENHQHYLLGRNREGLCYVSAVEGAPMADYDIWGSQVYTAKYILMLSEMLSHE